MRKYDYDDHVRAIAGPTLDQQERMTELRRLAIALIGTGALAGLLLLTIAIVQIVTGEAR